jgi:hypothetical protein
MSKVLAFAVLITALGIAPAYAQEDSGWVTGLYWSSGCLVSHYYYPTHTTVSGRPGPAGYTRYVDIGYVHFCLPV